MIKLVVIVVLGGIALLAEAGADPCRLRQDELGAVYRIEFTPCGAAAPDGAGRPYAAPISVASIPSARSDAASSAAAARTASGSRPRTTRFVPISPPDPAPNG